MEGVPSVDKRQRAPFRVLELPYVLIVVTYCANAFDKFIELCTHT